MVSTALETSERVAKLKNGRVPVFGNTPAVGIIRVRSLNGALRLLFWLCVILRVC